MLAFTLNPPRFTSPRDLVQLAVDLEAAGAGLLCTNENDCDALAQLTAVGLATKQCQLGTCIVTAFPRHPLELARTVSTVEALVGPDRLTLGLGPGRRPTVEGRLRIDYSKPLARTRDYLTVLRATLDTTAPSVDIQTAYYSNVGSGLTWPVGRRIPIILAALHDGMIKLAGEMAEGMLATYGGIGLFGRWKALMAEGAARTGLAPTSRQIWAVRLTCISPSRQEALDLARQTILDWPASRLYLEQLQTAGLVSPAAGMDDTAVRQMAFAGTLGEVREQIAAFHDAGGDVPLLSVSHRESDYRGAMLSLAETLG